MHKSFNPSYFNVNERAANRLSFSIILLTNWDKTVLDTMNEHVDPTTVALA